MVEAVEEKVEETYITAEDQERMWHVFLDVQRSQMGGAGALAVSRGNGTGSDRLCDLYAGAAERK